MSNGQDKKELVKKLLNESFLVQEKIDNLGSRIESLKLKLGCHKKPQDETNKSCADVFLDNFSNIEDMAQLRNRVLNEIDDFTQQLQLRCLRLKNSCLGGREVQESSNSINILLKKNTSFPKFVSKIDCLNDEELPKGMTEIDLKWLTDKLIVEQQAQENKEIKYKDSSLYFKKRGTNEFVVDNFDKEITATKRRIMARRSENKNALSGQNKYFSKFSKNIEQEEKAKKEGRAGSTDEPNDGNVGKHTNGNPDKQNSENSEENKENYEDEQLFYQIQKKLKEKKDRIDSRFKKCSISEQSDAYDVLDPKKSGIYLSTTSTNYEVNPCLSVFVDKEVESTFEDEKANDFYGRERGKGSENTKGCFIKNASTCVEAITKESAFLYKKGKMKNPTETPKEEATPKKESACKITQRCPQTSKTIRASIDKKLEELKNMQTKNPLMSSACKNVEKYNTDFCPGAVNDGIKSLCKAVPVDCSKDGNAERVSYNFGTWDSTKHQSSVSANQKAFNEAFNSSLPAKNVTTINASNRCKRWSSQQPKSIAFRKESQCVAARPKSQHSNPVISVNIKNRDEQKFDSEFSNISQSHFLDSAFLKEMDEQNNTMMSDGSFKPAVETCCFVPLNLCVCMPCCLNPCTNLCPPHCPSPVYCDKSNSDGVFENVPKVDSSESCKSDLVLSGLHPLGKYVKITNKNSHKTQILDQYHLLQKAIYGNEEEQVNLYRFPEWVRLPPNQSLKVWSACFNPEPNKEQKDLVAYEVMRWCTKPNIVTKLCNRNLQNLSCMAGCTMGDTYYSQRLKHKNLDSSINKV